MHPGAVLAQDFSEAVVLIACPLGPHHIVEEQIGRIRRSQPLEFAARAVNDHLAQRPDLGLDAYLEGRGRRHQITAAVGAVTVSPSTALPWRIHT